METPERSQARRSHGWEKRGGVGSDLIVPNPKLKLLDKVREVMRLKHYSIRTEQGQLMRMSYWALQIIALGIRSAGQYKRTG